MARTKKTYTLTQFRFGRLPFVLRDEPIVQGMIGREVSDGNLLEEALNILEKLRWNDETEALPEYTPHQIGGLRNFVGNLRRRGVVPESFWD